MSGSVSFSPFPFLLGASSTRLTTANPLRTCCRLLLLCCRFHPVFARIAALAKNVRRHTNRLQRQHYTAHTQYATEYLQQRSKKKNGGSWSWW